MIESLNSVYRSSQAEVIKSFCKKWNIKELSFFGSVVTERFNDKSDLDILISFSDNSHYGLFELSEINIELEHIFRRSVDLVTRNSVERNSNPIRRRSILNNLRFVYEE